MKDNVDYLPVWKKTESAEERFMELAMIARKHPERFGKIVVLYEETQPSTLTKVRYISLNCTTNELIGILEIGKMQVYADTSA